jgi:hypothetical protein
MISIVEIIYAFSIARSRNKIAVYVSLIITVYSTLMGRIMIEIVTHSNYSYFTEPLWLFLLGLALLEVLLVARLLWPSRD